MEPTRLKSTIDTRLRAYAPSLRDRDLTKIKLRRYEAQTKVIRQVEHIEIQQLFEWHYETDDTLYKDYKMPPPMPLAPPLKQHDSEAVYSIIVPPPLVLRPLMRICLSYLST